MVPAEKEQPVVYRFGKFILDARERALLADGKPIHLTNKVFETLLLLVRHNGRLLTKDEMMAAVWEDSYVEESNLTKNISRLRKILNTNDTQLIETLPKKGYRFLAEVEEMDGDGTLLLNRHLRVKITHTEADETLSAGPKDREIPPRPALLPPGKTIWKPVFVVGVVAAIIGLALYLWVRPAREERAAADNSGPVRLTNSPYNEDIAHWTTDNRIIVARIYSPGDSETFVVNPDGSGERPASDKADLRAGAWSRDGKKVLFLRKSDGVITTHIANADGSGEIEMPFRNGPLDWSPDGKMVVFNSNFKDKVNSEIYIYEFERKKLTNLSNSPAFDANPAFSPDGKQIVFNSNRDDPHCNSTYLMNADGTNIRRLTDHPAGEAFPSFAPDGTQIIFESLRENERVGIYLMNVDGQSPPIKISDTAYNSEIRTRPFSPDGTQIAFTSDKEGDKYNLYRMSAEPFKPRIVIESPDKDLTGPSLSPDGKLLAYQARSADKTVELSILDLDQGRSQVLARAADSSFSPAWSPSGDLIAITRKDQGNTDICTIRPDGSELKNLTAHPSTDFNPAWSATGEEIFFSSNRDGSGGGATRLFRMNRDGSQQRSVTGKYGYEMTPAASSDGIYLAFSGDRQDGRSRALDIFLVRFDDPENEQILALRPGHDSAPAFSPDGKRIAFVSNSDGNQEIYLVNTDGTGLVRLTRNPADDTLPTFSPDGKRIIFSSNRNGRFAIYEAELPY